MASKDFVLKFLSGGAPVVLFVEEPSGVAASSVFEGDRPNAAYSLTDFVPGWQLYTCCNDFTLTTTTDCNLNTALFVACASASNEDESEDEAIDVASVSDTAGLFSYNSILNLPLSCVFVRDNKNIEYNADMDGYHDFARMISALGMVDAIDINSPNSYLYIRGLLDAVKRRKTNSSHLPFSMFATIFDYKQFNERLGIDDLKSQHEMNSEFAGYSLMNFELSKPVITTDLALVRFEMSLVFSKPIERLSHSYLSFVD